MRLTLLSLVLLFVPQAFAQTASDSAAAPDAYLVQAGVFVDAARAYGRAATLRGARVLSEDGVHRVVMGPYATLAAASAEQARLQARGVDGFVRSAAAMPATTTVEANRGRALPTPVQASTSAPAPRRTLLSTGALHMPTVSVDARRW